MKRLILSILILAFTVTVHAGPIGTIKRDPILYYEKSYIGRDAKGEEVGSIRPDYLRPGEYRFLDSTGKQTGRIKKDAGYLIEKVNDR